MLLPDSKVNWWFSVLHIMVDSLKNFPSFTVDYPYSYFFFLLSFSYYECHIKKNESEKL